MHTSHAVYSIDLPVWACVNRLHALNNATAMSEAAMGQA